jgi:hypothetical protein
MSTDVFNSSSTRAANSKSFHPEIPSQAKSISLDSTSGSNELPKRIKRVAPRKFSPELLFFQFVVD